MKVVYDPDADTLTITFLDTTIWDSSQDRPGAVLNYDADGNLASLVIPEASRRVMRPMGIDFQIAQPEA
jgi:uncharacterized protein YuzE